MNMENSLDSETFQSYLFSSSQGFPEEIDDLIPFFSDSNILNAKISDTKILPNPQDIFLQSTNFDEPSFLKGSEDLIFQPNENQVKHENVGALKKNTVSDRSKKIKKNGAKSEQLGKKLQNNPEKNILKIVGNSIISKIIRNNFFDKKIIQRITRIYGVDPKQFTEWVIEQKFIETLINFESFRELYTDSKINGRDKNFNLVLREITSWFLENEIYFCFIFEKKFTVDKILYLKKIPRIMEGLSCPSSFYSLMK